MIKSHQSNIHKAYIFHFLISLHFIGGVLIPFFTDWGRISFFQIMILQSWFVIWSFILEVPTGAIADYFGRKKSLVLATLVNIIGVLIYTSKPDFTVFLIGELFWALAVALFSGANEALVYDSLKTNGKEFQSKKILSRFESFALAGMMIGAPLGSLIASTLGLRWTMLLMIMPLTIALFLALTFKDPGIKKTPKSRGYLKTMFRGIKYLYSHKTLKVLALDGIVVAILTFLLIWTYQLLLIKLQVNLVYFGVIHALIAGSQIIVMINFSRLEKVLGSKKRYLTFSALISGIAFIVLGINVYIVPAIIGIVVASAFGLSRFVLINNYMQKHIESETRATVISAIAMFRKIGMAITYPIVGLLVEWSLSFTLMLIGLTIVIFSLIPKNKDSDLID